jgi:hypothetical protein
MTQTPQQYAGALAFYRDQGYEAPILSQFDQEYSPEAVARANKIAIGPVEAAKLVNQLPEQEKYVKDYLAGGNPTKQPLPDTPENRNAARAAYQAIKPIIGTNLQITAGGLAPNAATPPKTPNATSQTAPGGWVTSAGKTLNDVPSNIRGEVQQVLEYRRSDPSITQRGVVAQAINQWVADLDPQHDATTFPAKNKILSETTKSMAEGQLGSLNTALGHLNELYTAAQELSKSGVPFTASNFPLLHSLANKVGAAIGNDAGSTYTAILHRVGPEMTAAYVKGGGGEGERGANEKDFDLSKGQQQIISNIAESAALINSKLAPTRQNWNQTFQPYRDADKFDNRFLTPDAKEILSRIGGQAPTMKGAGPAKGFTRIQASDGNQHDIPNANLERARMRDKGLTVIQAN